jgi:hypothetical protein
VSSFNISDVLQSQEDVLASGNDLLKVYDTDNSYPYSQVDITENPGGQITNAQVSLNPVAVSAGVGQILGSAIGRALAGNNQFAQLASGTVAGLIGLDFATVLST